MNRDRESERKRREERKRIISKYVTHNSRDNPAAATEAYSNGCLCLLFGNA